jgi:dipeptidyl-peptidase-4
VLLLPGAEHVFIDFLAYARKHDWDFRVREFAGAWTERAAILNALL